MARPVVLALAGVALLAIGALGGFFFYQYRVMELSFSSIFLARELNAARENFLVMKSIADGNSDQAYVLAEGRVVSAMMTLNAFPDTGQEAEEQKQEFLTRLVAFYDRYPERSTMLTHFPDLKAVLEVARKR